MYQLGAYDEKKNGEGKMGGGGGQSIGYSYRISFISAD